MRTLLALLVIGLLAPSARAQGRGLDVTMPLVGEALGFLGRQALDAPPDAVLLRAGVLRVCGPDLSQPGCKAPGLPLPAATATGPDAAQAWRTILESALAAQLLADGRYDKTVFQRFVVDAMVEALDDPASFYIAPPIYRKMASIPEDFTGFGLAVIPNRGHIEVLGVSPGSPAAAAGVRPGDHIVTVGGEPVTGFRRASALCALWGGFGGRLEIGIETGADAPTREVSLSYQPWRFEPFRLETVGGTLVVRVRHFSRGLDRALATALAAGPRGLVLDLSQTATGLEDEMLRVADLLLGAAKLGRRSARSDLAARALDTSAATPGERVDLPLVVIIGPSTAGPAQLLAAGLRRTERALLIGRGTSGRDTLDTLQPLSDGSAIQATTQRLVGPDGAKLGSVQPHVQTLRPDPVDLAVTIVDAAPDPSLDALREAARRLLAQP